MRITSQQFERLLQVYGIRGYNFLRDVGGAPGDVYEFSAVGSVPAAFAGTLARVKTGHAPRGVPAILLEALVSDGYLRPGEYVIDTTPEEPLEVRYVSLLRQHGGPAAPECLAFVQRHGHDRAFAKRVKTIDTSWGG